GGVPADATVTFNDAAGLHCVGDEVRDGAAVIGAIGNGYLARPQNRSNLCAALAVARVVGVDPAAALRAAMDFQGLPHRQPEVGGNRLDIRPAASMAEAVGYAIEATPPGGVVLLSPAAPSYGTYKDFMERGRDFVRQAGLAPP